MDDIYSMYYNYYDYDMPALDVANGVIVYASPVLLALATVGNVLAFVIMRRLYHEVHAQCVYLAIAAVLDLAILYTRCGNDWLRHVTAESVEFYPVGGTDLSFAIQNSSNVACKAYTFAHDFIIKLHHWLMVCMAVESYVITRKPSKASPSQALSRTKAIILLVLVLLCCFNIHYFWTWDKINVMEEDEPNATAIKLCSSELGSFQLVNQLLNVLLLTDVLPVLLVIVFTALTVVDACRAAGSDEKLAFSAWQKRYLLYPDAIRQLKCVIVVIDVLYIASTLPTTIKHLYNTAINYVGVAWEGNFQAEAEDQLVTTLCDMARYLFLSVKFYVYVAMSAQFRHELAQLFRRRGRRRRRSKHSTVNNTPQPMTAQQRPLMTRRSLSVEYDDVTVTSRATTTNTIGQRMSNYSIGPSTSTSIV